MQPPAPVPASDRLESPDVLRGFALLAILAMNIRAMAAPFSAYMYPYALSGYTGAGRTAFTRGWHGEIVQMVGDCRHGPKGRNRSLSQ